MRFLKGLLCFVVGHPEPKPVEFDVNVAHLHPQTIRVTCLRCGGDRIKISLKFHEFEIFLAS